MPNDIQTKAEKAFEALLADLTDRRGFRQTWDGIDRDTRAEIRQRWVALITQAFEPE